MTIFVLSSLLLRYGVVNDVFVAVGAGVVVFVFETFLRICLYCCCCRLGLCCHRR